MRSSPRKVSGKIPASMNRRSFALGAAGLAAAGAFAARRAVAGELATGAAHPELDPIDALVAKPPPGFAPLTMPGKIVKARAKGDFASFMQLNQLWPKAEVARRLFERAMTEFTGASSAVEAMKRFIHKDDAVAIKVNGIAGQHGYTMAVNFELILPVVEAVLAVGVPAERVMVYEQYPTYLMGSRVNVRDWQLPKGVKVDTHNNVKHTMPAVRIYQGIKTRYCRFFTEATAVIDMTQIKDHSICGYTGTMKNITHGNINNPEDHHAHQASPQIAMLYNHPIVTSRVRLHITDAFKIIYDRGPLDRNPQARIPHGAVYVATDAVAMDAFGWKVVDDERKAHGMKSLKESLREPRYIHTASDLGIGIADMNRIRVKSVEV